MTMNIWWNMSSDARTQMNNFAGDWRQREDPVQLFLQEAMKNNMWQWGLWTRKSVMYKAHLGEGIV